VQIAVSKEVILVLIKFRVRGALRYICHAEMLKVFQRACARAGIEIQHSQGYNPRPRLSLPLPRPVGVESDEELLCLRCSMLDTRYSILNTIKAKLGAQLPEGCELLSVSLAKADTSFQPCLVTYVLPVRQEYLNDQLRARIERLSASESLAVERRIDSKKSKIENRKSKIKMVDVRPFLESIEWDDSGIVVKCKITSAGSIRVDEILNLLEIDVEKLTAPVRRTNVQWQEPENRRQNNSEF